MFDWFIQHAMSALYPRTDELPGIADTEPRAFLRAFRREASLLMQLGVIAGAAVFIWSPILTVYWPLPSFLLPRAVLDRHASRISYSGIYLVRQSVVLVKVVAGMCWGQHAITRGKMALAPYPEDPGTWRVD